MEIKLSAEQQRALSMFPPAVKGVITKQILPDETVNEGAAMMMSRWTEFSSLTAAILSGVYMDDTASMMLDEAFDAEFARTPGRVLPRQREIVVGAGLHAAIYCAVRQKTYPKAPRPLVLESSDRVGGAFAVSKNPSFYLNSRNRPGPLDVPGSPMGSLNVLPGAVLQPADIGSSEYQANSELAFVIRATLAAYAKVIPNTDVSQVRNIGMGGVAVLTRDGRTFNARRVVVASGLGKPNEIISKTSRLVSFQEFMRKMDEPFPLRGMRKIAVVGAGDSARTAIEALTGQGPLAGWSVASLDYPDEIHWYGCPQLTRLDWEQCNRSRYKGIGRLLPNGSALNPPSRVRPFGRATRLSAGFECVYVNSQPYDHVINCTGYLNPITMGRIKLPNALSVFEFSNRRLGKWDNGNTFVIGPAADLAASDNEGLRNVESGVALYRYAGRTAQLAATLDR